LHLTTIEDAFDPSRDVAFGPHCFIGRDNSFPKWQEITFVEPFPDEASLVAAEENVRGLVNHLLPGLVQQLNAYHGTTYSIDFWRLLVLPWLIELTQKSWASFVRLRQLYDRFGDRPLTVPVIKGNPEWDFDDVNDFFATMLKNYRFNWWIDSQMIAALQPANWRLQPSDQISPPKSPVLKEPPLVPSMSKFRVMMRNFKYWLGYTDILGIRWSGLLLAVYVNLLPKSPSRMRFAPDPDFRPELCFPAPYLDVLNRLIDATMPESLLDGFAALADRAKRLPYVPGRLRLGALSFWNEQEKVIAAFAKEAGEKRVVFQHGGEYGMVKYNIMANEVELRSTIFISWGWTFDKPTGDHVLPLPSPFHSKIANRHKRRNDSLIVVGQPIRIHIHRLHWVYRINYPRRHCAETIEFLESLGETIFRSVVFRPYARAANDIDIGDVVREHFPKMPILENDFHGAIMKCRLVVLYSYSTTMNHTMAANVPTVVYVDPDLMTPHKEAEPFFEPLRRCGVIHDSPQAAAQHINRIWDDVEGWWLSDEVQAARKIWNHQYARTDRFWWWQWMKALARLKNVG